VIELRDVTVRYGEKTVLDHFSCRVPAQGLTWLSGPSGAGKTTLLRVLAGLIRPQTGCAVLPGVPVMLFQENRLFPRRNARQQVEAVLPRERREEAEEWLSLVELNAQADKRPGQLSGGMARRCALARALAAEGDVWLLDEPFSGVDLDRAGRILRRLRALERPMMIAGHSPELAALCERIVNLDTFS